ncbi:hypothetical protein MTO96_013536 [Rhipicephalus appendiculatus]
MKDPQTGDRRSLVAILIWRGGSRIPINPAGKCVRTEISDRFAPDCYAAEWSGGPPGSTPISTIRIRPRSSRPPRERIDWSAKQKPRSVRYREQIFHGRSSLAT